MSIHHQSITLSQYRRAVQVRDLTDPGQGPHALQLLVDALVDSLEQATGARARIHRANPVIPIEDNYDRLLYSPDGKARDSRYTRYVSDRLLLRTQTSAMLPGLLEQMAPLEDGQEHLLVCPGIVYRRDQIDRWHSSEPHQVDLWRIRRGPPLGASDLDAMVRTVVQSTLPGYEHICSPATHPYTIDGVEISARPRRSEAGAGTEIGEAGLAHPRLLAEAGLGTSVTGLAMGLGLDRLLMLRKALPDIRLLRSDDPRVVAQMQDLASYRSVSRMPAIRCDMSVMVEDSATLEELGDRVRGALGGLSAGIESLTIRSETALARLPAGAVQRMGAMPGQKNVLLRVVLRDLHRTLSRHEANELRNRIYLAVHRGTEKELC